MKTYLKIFLAAFLIFPLCSVTMGQSLKGKFVVSGDSKINFSSITSKTKSNTVKDDEGSTSTSFGFSPSVGYFVTSGLALGIGLPLNVSTSKDNSTNFKTQLTSIAAAPFARYYIGAKNVKLFLNGDFGIGSMMEKYGSSGSSYKSTFGLFLYDIGAGVGIFINEHCSFDTGLAYSHTSYKPTKDNPDNARSVMSGIKLDFGINVFF